MANEEPLDFGADLETLGYAKEIKLQLPLRTHIRLRAEKLLHGQTIATTVNAAVSAYFGRHPVAGSPDVFVPGGPNRLSLLPAEVACAETSAHLRA